MLVAIVGLRVEVLKLGSGVGSQLQEAASLQSSNAVLRAQISSLSDNERIQQLAESYGMHMPNPLDVHFVQASAGRDLSAAIHNITQPSTETYLSGLATERESDAVQTGETVSAVGDTATDSTATTSGSADTTDSAVTTDATDTADSADTTDSVDTTDSADATDTTDTADAGVPATTDTSSDDAASSGSPPASGSVSTNGGASLAG